MLTKIFSIFYCIFFLIFGWLFLWTLYEYNFLFSDQFVDKSNLMEFRINFKNIKKSYWMEAPKGDQCPNGTTLLVLIPTRRNAFEVREAVRQSWARDALPDTVIRFIVADVNELTNIAEMWNLEKEQKLYGDVVAIKGYEDTYANLPLKIYGAFEWQMTFCPGVDFILKTDDDSVVNLPRLDYWIANKFRKELAKNPATIYGALNAGIRPVREPKSRWYVPQNVFPGPVFPPYTRGATYLVSRQAISKIMAQTDKVLEFSQEDVVFTGILANLANVSHSNQTGHFAIRFSKKWLTQYEISKGNNISCEGGTPKAISLFGIQKFIKNVYELLWTQSCY